MTPPKKSARELAALINGLPMSKEGLLLDAGQVVEIIEALVRAAEVERALDHIKIAERSGRAYNAKRIASLEAQLAAAQEALLEREADWNAVVRIARQQAEALGYLWNCDLSAADYNHVRPAMEAYNQADVIGGPMCAARRAEGAEHE